MEVDLHGLTHESAKRKVIEVIDKHFNSDIMVKFITGNSQQMREVVLSTLSEYQITQCEYHFSESEIIVYLWDK